MAKSTRVIFVLRGGKKNLRCPQRYIGTGDRRKSVSTFLHTQKGEYIENVRNVRVCRKRRPEKTKSGWITFLQCFDLAIAYWVSVHIPSSTDAVLLFVDGKIQVRNLLSKTNGNREVRHEYRTLWIVREARPTGCPL